MKLFHGSNMMIDKVDLSKSKLYKDSGQCNQHTKVSSFALFRMKRQKSGCVFLHIHFYIGINSPFSLFQNYTPSA